jgi:hypothetical protein
MKLFEHPDFEQAVLRAEEYQEINSFGKVLPSIGERVRRDARPTACQDFAAAT